MNGELPIMNTDQWELQAYEDAWCLMWLSSLLTVFKWAKTQLGVRCESYFLMTAQQSKLFKAHLPTKCPGSLQKTSLSGLILEWQVSNMYGTGVTSIISVFGKRDNSWKDGKLVATSGVKYLWASSQTRTKRTSWQDLALARKSFIRCFVSSEPSFLKWIESLWYEILVDI